MDLKTIYENWRANFDREPEAEYESGKRAAHEMQREHSDYRERVPAAFDHMRESRDLLSNFAANGDRVAMAQMAYINGYLSVWGE